LPGRPISGLAWQAQAPDRRWLLVESSALAACIDRASAERVGVANRREWWLIPAGASHCRIGR